MDFKLTDEQELIVDSYREYMESENWETYFHECDEAHEYPLRWVKGLCELGFDQIMLPESHGGLGLEPEAEPHNFPPAASRTAFP
uniref:acyl-CoA dehydrogenase family protein n=1 Tax=Eggerthella sinensis TaxID=242230 RepID=UPI00248EBFEB